ncbi:MAG: hypothetical protein JXR46_06310 [Calditrichaceae bacterium]|nr:hypothetical protein [Calditrichaceae bacterium]MBN2708640.1 hypothetical protein [Calditrichaceae bacterium]RQV92025.1 MAG: hypothetical protein EH224_16620 [Calditrichota bacterium]
MRNFYIIIAIFICHSISAADLLSSGNHLPMPESIKTKSTNDDTQNKQTDINKKVNFYIDGAKVSRSEFKKQMKKITLLEETKSAYKTENGGVTEYDAADSSGARYRYELEHGLDFENYNLWHIPEEPLLNVTTPWQISLRISDDLVISASIKNVSEYQQYLLFHHNCLQPFILNLLNEKTGEIIKASDLRDYSALTDNATETSFIVIAPGDSIFIESRPMIKDEDGAYHLKWDCFNFEKLHPGRYSAWILWQSSVDRWQDSKTREMVAPGTIWLGDIESNKIKFTLPVN